VTTTLSSESGLSREPGIGEVLRFLRLSGIFYCPSELTEPWGLALPPMEDCLWFHVVTAGSCTIEVEPGQPRTVGVGDLVLVPHGAGHRAWGAEPAPTPSVLDLPHEYVNDRYAVLRHGGGGARTDVVCGGVRFDHPGARHLVAALPPLIHVEAARTPRADWLHATLGLMADETSAVRIGGDAVVSRLCDIVVIQALRSWIERDPDAQNGWIGALRDPQIGRALARIHAEPAAPWTVGSLAAEVAMSRSAFAARFTELVGEPVMRYVTRWRMLHALDHLETTDATVAAAGRLVGYDSEAAFSRAFTRLLGTPPSAARSRTSAPLPLGSSAFRA
jgi:AraC-like DNA-binding protein